MITGFSFLFLFFVFFFFCNPNLKQTRTFSDTVREISIKLQQVERECLCCLWGFLIVFSIIFNFVRVFYFHFIFSEAIVKHHLINLCVLEKTNKLSCKGFITLNNALLSFKLKNKTHTLELFWCYSFPLPLIINI